MTSDLRSRVSDLLDDFKRHLSLSATSTRRHTAPGGAAIDSSSTPTPRQSTSQQQETKTGENAPQQTQTQQQATPRPTFRFAEEGEGGEYEDVETIEVDLDFSEDELLPREEPDARKSSRKKLSPAAKQRESGRRLSRSKSPFSERCLRHFDSPQSTPREFQQLLSTSAEEDSAATQPRKKAKQGAAAKISCKVLDFVSKPSCYVIRVDLSAFDESEIKLSLQSDSSLLIKANHEEEHRREDENVTRGIKHKSVSVKKSIGSVERRIKLPTDAEGEASTMKATFEKGVLTIVLPKQGRSLDERTQDIPLS